MSMDEGAQVFDDALPPRLFDALLRATAEMPSRSVSFWTDRRAVQPPLIVAALAHLRPLVNRPAADADGSGVEWWVRRAPAYHFQPWHVDKDEALFMRTGRVRCPTAGSILYLTEAGGLTIVSSQVCADDGSCLVPRRLEAAWLVKPRPNRFLVFPGKAAHAVLPQADTSHSVRSSLPVNWWPTKSESNARLSTYAGRLPRLLDQLNGCPPAEAGPWRPVPVPLVRYEAADFPRVVEQQWPMR